MSVLRSHNNKTRGGLGRVCETGMYRSIEHLKFAKFQTGIFVKWKAPLISPDMKYAVCCAEIAPVLMDRFPGFYFQFEVFHKCC